MKLKKPTKVKDLVDILEQTDIITLSGYGADYHFFMDDITEIKGDDMLTFDGKKFTMTVQGVFDKIDTDYEDTLYFESSKSDLSITFRNSIEKDYVLDSLKELGYI